MSGPTTNELLDEIQRLEEELGETPTSIDMNESGEYWAKDYQDHFGGWNDALREAGLEPNQPRKIPTDDLLNELQRLAKKFNKVPTKKQMNDVGEYYGQSYRKRFGSWSEAVRQAGFEPNQRIPESEFQEEPEACLLCNSSPTERLDFHHWRYGDNKAGCYLCRDCHDQVHAGGARPQEDADWLLQAVENLIRIHKEQQDNTSVAAITDRYNIPSEGLVKCVIADIDM
jgi:hypothetical protein